MSAYQALTSDKQVGRQRGSLISRTDVPLGYTLYVFDFDQHIDTTTYFPAVKKGNCRVEAHFSTPLTETANVIIYGTFRSVFEVDSASNIIL